MSGADLVVSVTSAGQISPIERLPCFVLIDRALSDGATSSHYQPPARWSHLDRKIRAQLDGTFDHLREPVLAGASWTTDAPYRETATAIAAAEAEGIACVEMEAAALTPTPPPANGKWCAWRTSLSPWPPMATTSTKASTTACTTRSRSSAPPP